MKKNKLNKIKITKHKMKKNNILDDGDAVAGQGLTESWYTLVPLRERREFQVSQQLKSLLTQHFTQLRFTF